MAYLGQLDRALPTSISVFICIDNSLWVGLKNVGRWVAWC